MKKTIGILLGCLCILLLESGVKRIEKKPALTITPSRLQLFVDQHTDPYTIKIVYTLNIPHGFIPSCARMVYQPYFLSAGHRYDLTPLVVSGKNNLRQEKRLTALTDKQPDYPEALRLISEGEGMQVRLSETVPFELWMAQAKLRADVTLEACDRKSVVPLLPNNKHFPSNKYSHPQYIRYHRDNLWGDRLHPSHPYKSYILLSEG